MTADAERAQVGLPDELLNEVDQIVGQQERGRFVEEAVREKVLRERQARAIRQRQAQAIRDYAGVLNPADYPEWSTPEKISRWVHDLRHHSETCLEHESHQRAAR